MIKYFDCLLFRLQVSQNNFVRETSQEVKSPLKMKTSNESLVNKVKRSVSKAYNPDNMAEKKVDIKIVIDKS